MPEGMTQEQQMWVDVLTAIIRASGWRVKQTTKTPSTIDIVVTRPHHEPEK